MEIEWLRNVQSTLYHLPLSYMHRLG